jgi:anaerobic magnesium-protoporphyrin IX monomethyl ester cyclase
MKKRRIHKIAVVGFEGFLEDYTITHFRMPRIGPVMMATLLRDSGYEVKMFAEGVKHFTKSDLDYILSADFVAISVLTYGANRAYAMTSLIRHINPHCPILIGDVHATVMPDHTLRHCDYVIRGEGDEALLELMACLNKEEGAKNLYQIEGLSFWDGQRIVHNQKRARPRNIEVIPDLGLIDSFYEHAGWRSWTKGRLTLAVAQASRGCPVACKFCLGSAILGKEYRTRGIEGVIDNLKQIRRASNNRKMNVFFVDNHFFIDKRWTKDLLRAIIKEKFNFYFITFGQYFVGRDTEMLALLREARFEVIFVGFESINPNTLKEFNKRQSENSMRECIETIHQYGIDIHGSFMLGGETDTEETIEATLQFALDTDIRSASFFGLCEYPFEHYSFIPTTNCLPPARLLPKHNLDYYNLNFVSIYPKMMKPSQLQKGLLHCYQEFFSPKRMLNKGVFAHSRRTKARLFGYWAQRRMVKQMREYIPFLLEQEAGKYDTNNQLIESLLDDTLPDFVNPYPNLYNKVYGLSNDIITHPKEISEVYLNFSDNIDEALLHIH